jgi:hypothetical protein
MIAKGSDIGRKRIGSGAEERRELRKAAQFSTDGERQTTDQKHSAFAFGAPAVAENSEELVPHLKSGGFRRFQSVPAPELWNSKC